MIIDPSGYIVQAILIHIARQIVMATVTYTAYLVGRYWHKGIRGALKQWDWKDYGHSVLSALVLSIPGSLSTTICC